ncbi:alpha/beta fold hydrolase [Parahaliea sp. F7430]|uniref:Alpha/beta fold hydrolase n=1 Tax=Sediminihaliea albiluteola TaxID=2758564 RepID=A0A7W2YIE5_9GAMM|nr:alpha/beta fold hydrolase [Sediminihaliea albiluteola]MBA6411967.1 alpha/beta fold hydrolase [Sediminihaliea albiluteola]
MSIELYSSSAGSGPNVLLLHGLFGMGSNLGALARALEDSFCVHSLDLPNHGRSEWIEQMSLEHLASAVQGWAERKGMTALSLVGHSLGGKVAMRMALDNPALVTSLVVADIAPVAYPPRHAAVFSALAAVAEAGPRSRREAQDYMAQYIEEPGVRQFLSLSLQRDQQGLYRWRFNREGLERDYGAVRDTLVSMEAYTGPTLFVKGELSDYIKPQYKEAIEALFPRAQLKVIPNTGHWLHAEQPRLFNAVVKRFLTESSAES